MPGSRVWQVGSVFMRDIMRLDGYLVAIGRSIDTMDAAYGLTRSINSM